MKIHQHTYTQQLEQQHTNCGTDYDYYVNDSTEVTAGGTTINITGSTKLKQIPGEKCTITIKYANGTQTTVEVRKGSTYTLDTKLRWKVGDTTYDGGSNITVNEDIIIEEVDEITIIYTVDTSTTATGLGTEFLFDGTPIPTVQGSTTYTTTVKYEQGTTIEKLSDNYITPYNKNETVSKDRAVLSFKAWKVNGTSSEVNAEDSLTWEQLYNYAVNGEINLTTIWNSAYGTYNFVNFYIHYKSIAEDSTEGGIVTDRPKSNYTPSLWASYVGNANNKTANIADEKSDNSFTVNKTIRALEGDKGDASTFIYSIPSDEYIIEQLKSYAEEGKFYVDEQKVNADELDSEHYEVRWYVFKHENSCWHVDGKLVRKEGKMVVTKTFTGSKSAIETVTGYSFDTKTSSTNTDYNIKITGGDTSIRLYPQEGIYYCDIDEHTHNDDCYDEAGQLICTKEEHTHNEGTCSKVSQAVTVKDETTTSTIKEEDGTEKTVTTYLLTYTWEVDVKYGIKYILTEQQYNTDKYIVYANYNIIDPESTRFKKVYNKDGTYYYQTDENGNFVPEYTNQSKATTDGDTINYVIGVNNYAIDSTEELDYSKIINVNFRNTYVPESSITIKKQDSITNNGLSGAVFSLFAVLNETEIENEDGTITKVPIINEQEPLKFTYNESIYTYSEQGNVTEITSPDGGSITINKLPNGKYVLKEMSVPDGYDGNSAVQVTLESDGTNVTVEAITKGTGNKDDTNKKLELENASELGKVKITKAWDQKVPAEYRTSNITVDLYLNGKPLSSYDLDNDGVADGANSNMRVQLGISNDWTYTWENLPFTIDGAEAIYSAVEVKIGELDAVTNGQHNEDGTWQSYDAYTQYRAHTTLQTTKLAPDGKTSIVEFNLINDIHFVKIDINKINILGKPIENVTFKLQKIDETGAYIDIAEATTSSDGKISFLNLEYDTKYVLTEIKANQGYYLNDKPIYIMIKKGIEQGDPDRLFIYTSDTFETEAQASDYEENGYYEWISLSEDRSALNIINIAHTPMPKAGGVGVYSYYILGIFLMGSSTIIIYFRKNKIKKGR